MKGGKSIPGTGNSICGDLATDALHRGEMGARSKVTHTQKSCVQAQRAKKCSLNCVKVGVVDKDLPTS